MSKWLMMLMGVVLAGLGVADEYVPTNSQKPGDEPPPALVTVGEMVVPDGFEVRLFAGEPEVRQPISMCFDDRGRLWVAESYSYGDWRREGRDRVVVFEDEDGDGVHDRRTVFWDGGNHLSSVLVGFGGVWVMDSPELLFIPDADGDLVPDGPPVKKLEGFTLTAKHNMANGLSWGPDGWLWGRHGILGESEKVGRPGAKETEKVAMWCGMWRYHPVGGRFEPVFRGMTNGWGHDWDEHGHLFMSGNVNGHVWHGVPGAYYERMHGTGRYPYVYERLTMIGEKPHYPAEAKDWKSVWSKGDVGRAAENASGGGHSHAGAVIYQGGNWPAEYSGDLFMCNTHGRRINRDSLERRGGGFTSRYKGDLMTVKTPWFRGSSMVLGPAGGVYVSDWVDLGECHDDDGVHRTSGRIYRLTYGAPRALIPGGDLGRLSDEALVEMQRAENVWFSRRARRILQERAAGGGISAEAVKRLREMQGNGASEVERLRGLWGSWVTGHAIDWEALLAKGGEHERCWAVQLMCEGDADLGLLVKLAEEERSPLVRVYLASAMRKLGDEGLAKVGGVLLKRTNGTDVLFDNLLWYSIEPLVVKNGGGVGWELHMNSGSAELRRRIVRRLASEGDGELMAFFYRMMAPGRSVGGSGSRRDELVAEGLEAALEALRGRVGLEAPVGWEEVGGAWVRSSHLRLRAAASELGVMYGDPAVVGGVKMLVGSVAATASERSAALRVLVAADVAGLRGIVLKAFDDPVLRTEAIVGLQRFADDTFPKTVLEVWGRLTGEERVVALEGLVERKRWARQLLEAVGRGVVQRTEITANHAQRMVALRDDGVKRLLDDHWGAARSSGKEKRVVMARLRRQLTDEVLAAADVVNGEKVFGAVCAACHRLFGKGGRIGPDLTGGGRKELDYVLENVVDPAASVPQDYWMSFVTLEDGRILAGMVESETGGMLVLRTVGGERRLDKKRVKKVVRTYGSTMPEGLLEALSDEQVRDLVAYLRK